MNPSAREELTSTEDCYSCGESVTRNECASSKRPCGHHCNHSWDGDRCCWCGKEFDTSTEGEGTNGNHN